MSQQHGTSLTAEIPKNMGPGAIPAALGTLAMSAINNVEPSASTERPPPTEAGGSKALTTMNENDLKLQDDGGIPQKPTNQTTHVMTFTYKGDDKPKRKPRKMEPTPPGLYELTVGKKITGPLKQFETCPVKANAKEANTTEGISSGRYYSMVHQFPDIIASYGRGPTNLDRDTWKMSSVTTQFVPLTPRGRQRIMQHEQEMKEKARIAAYENRRWVKFCKALKSMGRLVPQKKFKPGQEYLKDRGPPVFPEDKARARQKAAEDAAAAQALSEAEETQSNDNTAPGMHEPQVNGLASDRHSEDQISPVSPTTQQKAKGRRNPVSESEDEDEDESDSAVNAQQTNSLAVRFDRLNTDNSPNLGCIEQANEHEKTFNVPTRAQNGFLNMRGN